MEYKILTQEEIDIKTRNIKRQKIHGKPKEKFRQVIFREMATNYVISSYGRLISLNYRGNTGKVVVMATKLTKCGYVSATLSIDGIHYDVLIHRLVGEAFIPNPENKPEINHKDGSKVLNYVWNLEWSTSKENIDHAWKTGLKQALHGNEITNSIYQESQIIEVCDMLERNCGSFEEISRATGVSSFIIRCVLHGRSWKHISCNYDFSKYTGGRDLDSYEKSIHTACKMLESNEYTIQEISNATGLGYGAVINISTGRNHRKISSMYNISNYKSKSPRARTLSK